MVCSAHLHKLDQISGQSDKGTKTIRLSGNGNGSGNNKWEMKRYRTGDRKDWDREKEGKGGEAALKMGGAKGAALVIAHA